MGMWPGLRQSNSMGIWPGLRPQEATGGNGHGAESCATGTNSETTSQHGFLAFSVRQGGSVSEKLRITSTGVLEIERGSAKDQAIDIKTTATTGASRIRFVESGTSKGELAYSHNNDQLELVARSGQSIAMFTNGVNQRLEINSGGSVNIGGDYDQTTYKMKVTGSFAATTKSFVIDHPTKEGMKLRHGSLEGPENGVYVRGRLKDNNTIELPDYWTGLVDEDTITVNLTPIGSKSTLHKVIDIYDNTVVVGSEDGNINCFYTVFGERKDVEKMEVEY